jgi:hypothetical protein
MANTVSSPCIIYLDHSGIIFGTSSSTQDELLLVQLSQARMLRGFCTFPKKKGWEVPFKLLHFRQRVLPTLTNTLIHLCFGRGRLGESSVNCAVRKIFEKKK